jgi:hypothetical protein
MNSAAARDTWKIPDSSPVHFTVGITGKNYGAALIVAGAAIIVAAPLR